MVQPRPLWTPSEDRVREANLTKFTSFVNQKYGLKVKSYSDLHRWSVDKVADFWSAVWDHTGIVASRRFDKVIDDIAKFPGAKWFLGARLNFAENLLRHRDDSIALVSRSEEGPISQTTYSDLYRMVGRLANALRKIGVLPGDRVAGYMPNIQETAVAMLAATSVGAVWACCGAELGSGAVLDRLGQTEPKLENLSGSISFDDLNKSATKGEPRFEQLPPDHPIYIMFTSGTTGKPK